MTYLSAKKIYPGNWAEPLNGWYKNIDTNDDGTNNASKGGPTSVLAIPGYRYFQQRGYVPVTATSGAGAVAAADVIVPSPYRQDDTRPDITGMVISGSSTLPAYVYRATISVASGWGDGRVASGVYAATGNVISFGRSNSGSPTAASGIGEAVIQANLTSTTSGSQAGEIFFAAGSAAYSANPFLIASGAAGVTAGNVYYAATASTTLKVFAKETANSTATSGGFYISSGDSTGGRTGYLVVEACYIQPDEAPGYEDIDGYLLGRTVS
ncbi:hypothetical protein EBT31_03885 [bacterium]|jgi:hypothetical protein|nr:hypothetical protein [bacterium]